MKCPYCEKEMKVGYLQNAVSPIQWIPETRKPPFIKGSVAKDAVEFGVGSLWESKGYTAEAYYCADCKIVIAKTNRF